MRDLPISPSFHDLPPAALALEVRDLPISPSFHDLPPAIGSMQVRVPRLYLQEFAAMRAARLELWKRLVADEGTLGEQVSAARCSHAGRVMAEG